jgi:hypothetical protein
MMPLPSEWINSLTRRFWNLVTPSSAAVTTVSTLDPVKAVFTVSEQEYLGLARDDVLNHLQLKLILADGSTHPHDGRFSFADRQVDPRLLQGRW